MSQARTAVPPCTWHSPTPKVNPGLQVVVIRRSSRPCSDSVVLEACQVLGCRAEECRAREVSSTGALGRSKLSRRHSNSSNSSRLAWRGRTSMGRRKMQLLRGCHCRASSAEQNRRVHSGEGEASAEMKHCLSTWFDANFYCMSAMSKRPFAIFLYLRRPRSETA